MVLDDENTSEEVIEELEEPEAIEVVESEEKSFEDIPIPVPNEDNNKIVTAELPKIKCHGCDGKGWVTAAQVAQKCPLCYGKGTQEVK